MTNKDKSLLSQDREGCVSDKDRAIEFGEYLAKSAEQFLDVLNRIHDAEENEDKEALERAMEARSDHWQGLCSSIYEFRKRAGRAAAPQVSAQPATERLFSLRHLQKHLPWTIPYSNEFERSASVNPKRRISHDVLHVMKSLGRVAAECESADHARPGKLNTEALSKEVADLVICALHIARLEGFDLHDAVISNSEARNAATIPPEAA